MLKFPRILLSIKNFSFFYIVIIRFEFLTQTWPKIGPFWENTKKLTHIRKNADYKLFTHISKLKK
jgi:hypothetical protein